MAVDAVASERSTKALLLFRSAANLNAYLIIANGKYRWPLYWNACILLFVPLVIVLVAKVTQSIVAVSVAMVVIYMVLFVAAYFLFVRRLLGAFGKQFFLIFWQVA